MKITVNEDNKMQLEEIFNSVVLKTRDGCLWAIENNEVVDFH